MALDEIREERLKKLNQLKEAGVDPYPATMQNSDKRVSTKTALSSEGKKVFVAGRIRSLRPHGKIAFSDLEDESGKIQLFFSMQELPTQFDLLSNLDIGDFLQAEGEVFTTQAGQLTVRVSSFQLLTKTLLPLPSAWHGFGDVEERYRQRYLDLIMNPDVKKVFDVRHKVIRLLRSFMEDKGFVEVETPTLQPIYGGATAKPFSTHHNALNIDLFLRISDELYLKRLIAGGYEKIFEICKDFRNEGIDRQHNPEFTMMEFYWAYADYEDLMILTEEMISSIVKEVHGNDEVEYEGKKMNFATPFERKTFTALVKEHSGIDLDEIETEEELLKVIKEKEIKIDLTGVIGFGPLCDELYKKVARPKIVNPTFITDYPYEMKPLSKRSKINPRKSASFQLLAVGYEIINAYNELNDPDEQKERWIEQMELAKKGLDEHQVLDADYLRALEYGMPPTAGWGMGVDRFVSLITDQHTIKEVILFPTMRPEHSDNSNKINSIEGDSETSEGTKPAE